MNIITYLTGVYPRRSLYKAPAPLAHDDPASHARLEPMDPVTTAACLAGNQLHWSLLGVECLAQGQPRSDCFFFPF